MKKANILPAAFCIVFAALSSSAAHAQDDNLIHNRLSFAKPGEWAAYSLPNGYTQKLTILDRAGDGAEAAVMILVENIHSGNVVDAREITEPAGERYASPRTPAEPGVFVAVRKGSAKIDGKDVPASVTEFNSFLGTEDEDVTEWWTNADIPVFGIVKKVSNGETEWEIADWGEGDGKPLKAVYENNEIKIVPAAEAVGKMSLADRAAALAKEAVAK